jgi:hypothetical protein
MVIKIVTTHIAAKLRMDVLIPTLLRHGHSITDSASLADLYILDCMRVDHIPEEIVKELLTYKGQVILTSMGDWSSFNLTMENHILPDEIVDKAIAFAKIQWTHVPTDYDPRIIGKQMVMQPFLIGGLQEPAIEKKSIASFYGLPTGDLETENNLRIRACRILKNKPWFSGGIVGQEPGARRDISGVEIGIRPRPFYLNSINGSLLSLCLPGNSILTYRHFESMGMKSCIVTCCLDRFKWLNRMIPGEHYLEVMPDLSNLVEVCEKALKDKKETYRIAQNGYDLYNEYYKLESDGGMTGAMWLDISDQWRAMGVNI